MDNPHTNQAQRLVEQATRAMSRHAAGDLHGAEMDYREVIDQVQHIGLYAGFGALLLQTRRLDEAAGWLRRALVLAPSRDAVIENLGVLLHERGQSGTAEMWLRRRLALSSNAPDALANLGIVLTATGCSAEAIGCLRMACQQQPDNPNHRFNLAVAMDKADDRLAAIEVYRQALCLEPGHVKALENAALSATLMNRSGDALDLYRHLVDVMPQHAVARFWRGNLRLLAGDWARGWEDYEARIHVPGLAPPVKWANQVRRWDGRPMPDGVLLLTGEQGIGDVLMFCRFLPLAAARVKRVVLQVHGPLVSLLQGQFANVTVQPFGEFTHTDAALPLLSLAGVLGMTPQILPRQPYLSAPPDWVRRWRAEAPSGEDRSFGLVWAGNPDYLYDRLRSPRLEPVRRLLDTPGWRPVLLQVGEGRRDLDTVTLPPHVRDLGEQVADFADTAAIIASLDLVITSDTAVAHLAGALGKETWVIGWLQADWRWMPSLDGRLLWYPTTRLFRQSAPRQWTDVVDDIQHALMS
ncbi:hypothetical protein [Azospirillum sp. Sh1]|uniref:hypothetical protein n=1 Tax=Azospirillum sp. Sh1 TaxID=2607285 RepID=UPI0011EC667A|nr:hypothetical protein [Azospirillum sp. Sh1]KAA0578724.1 hypothetical protein FZ029_09110 [Azospirillum sp. Sh1]